MSVDVPSYHVKSRATRSPIKAKSKSLLPIEAARSRRVRARRSSDWLALDEKQPRSGRMVRATDARPTWIPLAVQEQLIVELYSK